MKLLCITDPKTHPTFDTTCSLYKALAQHPDIDFFHAPASSINANGQLEGTQILGALSLEGFARLDDRPRMLLNPNELDLIFCRADDPLPDNFFEHLSRLENTVRFVNRPSQMIAARRKDFLADQGFEAGPDHIFSSTYEEIAAFFHRFNPMVAKMNMSYGGKGVYKIWQTDGQLQVENVVKGRMQFGSLEAVLDYLMASSPNGTYEFVRYLKNIDAGDKRVLVVEGEIYGAFLRKSKTGTWVHNVTAGAGYYPTTITERERTIITKSYPLYGQRGIHTLGYDFLMDDDGAWILSEINAGNVAGYDWHEEITGEPTLGRLVQWLMRFAEHWGPAPNPPIVGS